MSSIENYVFLAVPSSVNLSQFSNVQRGTIFIWFFAVFLVAIVTGIRVISGQMDVGRDKYEDNPQAAKPESAQNFQHEVMKSQVVT